MYPWDRGDALVCIKGHYARTVKVTQSKYKRYCVSLIVYKFRTFVLRKTNFETIGRTGRYTGRQTRIILNVPPAPAEVVKDQNLFLMKTIYIKGHLTTYRSCFADYFCPNSFCLSFIDSARSLKIIIKDNNSCKD